MIQAGPVLVALLLASLVFVLGRSLTGLLEQSKTEDEPDLHHVSASSTLFGLERDRADEAAERRNQD